MKQFIGFSVAVIAALSVMASSANAQFFDDFEYDVADPAVMTDWDWNGVGTAPNASRIFTTGNYGGSTLWIANADNAVAGSGINSTASIALLESTSYEFSANFVMETFDGARTGSGSYDLLVDGATVIGGPQAFAARGDNDGGAGDGSYLDQITTQAFTTGAAGNLEIRIAWDGSPEGAFAGVDNVGVSLAAIPEPGSLAFCGFAVLGMLVRRKRS